MSRTDSDQMLVLYSILFLFKMLFSFLRHTTDPFNAGMKWVGRRREEMS